MSIICQCEQLIREIVNEITRKENYDKAFLLYVTKRLKFENEEGWISLCSLMDVIGDTELAKKHFFNYGIDGPTKILDYGEQYLRLYGILNALYLQKSAIYEFLELVKIRHIKTIKQEINSLSIIKLRNILGSHTVDYIQDGKKSSYQFQRGSLSNRKIAIMDSKNNIEEFDLKESFHEYNKTVENILIQGIEKFINTIHKNGDGKRKYFINIIDLIKFQQQGGIVINKNVINGYY